MSSSNARDVVVDDFQIKDVAATPYLAAGTQKIAPPYGGALT